MAEFCNLPDRVELMSQQEVDRERRKFLVAATAAMGTVGAAAVAWPFVASMLPSARAKAAGAPVEVDISKIEPGAQGRGALPVGRGRNQAPAERR